MLGNALLHYIKVLLGSEQGVTQTSEAERSTLIKYCKQALVAVEIGVFEGVNTVLIATHMPDKGVLYGIDPFFKGRFGICYSKLITLRSLKASRQVHKICLIEKLSFDAVDDVPDEVDFIFIDGDHSLEGIKRDWNDWSGKIRTGGIIALHDTAVPVFDPSRSALGSVQYFSEVIKYDQRFEVIEQTDSLHILQRKYSQGAE
jgi:predicted O-methyltransferase YrrM